MGKNTGTSKTRKIIIASVSLVLITALIIGYGFYNRIYLPNVTLDADDESYIYIPTGSDFSDVVNILNAKNLLDNSASFEWVAQQMKYTANIKPGRYHIHKKMNNRELVTLLRSGEQTPVKLVFHNIRTKEQLASAISRQLEADSAALTGLLRNENFLKQYNMTVENCMSMFIPNTYEFYWNTSARQFVDKMAKEYKNFWNESRRQKAKNLNLTQTEISVIASIVEQETHKNDEKPLIAGVYLNRYRKGWKLEADPTLIFAAGDFTIQRVLNVHKEIDSPYNTYLNTGLPPGPICMPSIASLDAVLNYSRHDYMFFCAKDDFSGYHCFAKTYNEHLVNARRFQNELNRRRIRS